ncbi:MAG: glycosyltransferase WbuB, partial [Xanthomonadales bacterium]|nr:glycosyltransferase WbuB [Xanthomonadales bacterium]
MRILILSFYYPPDLSAGSFRVKALVDALQIEGGKALQIDVITTMPNRYRSHLADAAEYEEHDGVKIRRIVLPAHQSGMLDQARAFAIFALGVWGATQGKRWEIVFATSSRLMTAAMSVQIARRARAPLYLDIRDLFTDTMGDLLADSALKVFLPAFGWLEKRSLNAAQRVNMVSAGFLPHAKVLAPKQSFRTFTNGIDDDFLALDFSKPETQQQDLPLVVYAGNMGEGQGLHRVIPDAARRLVGKARFRLIGDGGCRAQLENALADAKVGNVEICDAVQRVALFEHYRQADILFLHLNDHPAFQKVLPSKIFEYAATGKPILAGVAGYPAEFLRDRVPGCEVFEPCDAVA